MAKITYDVQIKYPGTDEEVVSNLEFVGPGDTTNEQVAQIYLDKILLALEKLETGKRGAIQIGGQIFPVNDERMPRLWVNITSVVQDASSDGLHAPEV